ncbi:uncharacterized protein LOC111480631 [Cucurbita maxima]|uniref:Uncharacterized protein LOC111480631 n=1 Tax=Cucurbita maxima TaxID=3661 RepID=A0A6J1IU93_CUCMA|nr:uncharacterized protein LOC111480631 [Cucurbita maxima]XP_022981547.1 uncharacterized protein LOC111480631 [Cucurbita maxima]
MSTAKQLGKSQADRLVKIEDQLLYSNEVLDRMKLLESCMNEIAIKADKINEMTGRLEAMSVRELMIRVETLEEKAATVGGFEYGDSSTGFVARMEERIEDLKDNQQTIVQMVSEMSKGLRATIGVVKAEVADLNTKLNLTTRAVGNQTPVGGVIQYIKLKVPEPKPFCGDRDAKALENFIFDFEQYFRATNTVAEEMKVTVATMYLDDYAKLWWRSKYMDIQDGRCTVDTWESLKQELRSKFIPHNIEIIARRKLRELRHTDNILHYVKQFSEIMLDIHDMSETDKVFNFINGLKPWAKTKLYEQRVQDLSTAYVTAEHLFDLRSINPHP